MYLLLALAVLIAPAQRLTGRRRYGFLADAATVLGGGFMVVWYFNITPIADGQPATYLWVSAIGNPIGDLLLLMAVALVLMRGTLTRAISPMALYLAGLGCYLVGDAIWPSIGPDGVRAAGLLGSARTCCSPPPCCSPSRR